MKSHRRRFRFRYRENYNLFKRFLWQKRRLLLIGIASAVIIAVTVCIISYNSVTTAAAMNLAATASASNAAASPEPLPDPTPTPDLTLKRGDQNVRVQQLQQRLMQLGYLDLDEPTQLFGPVTEEAVKIFQRQHKFDQTGIADAVLQDLINSDQAQPYELLQGTSGDDVDSLQQQLIGLGYLSKATGYYGTETINAVKTFQQRNGLTADGNTGAQTLQLMYSPNAKVSETKANQVKKRANILQVLATAQKQLGKPYVWGAEGPSSFDCSGLVYYCLEKAGSSRNRYDAAGYSQVSDWTKITSMDKLEKGDLMFFSTNGKRVGHTGIYVGGGMMIDASSANGKVVERECKTSFWEDNFVVGRRPW